MRSKYWRGCLLDTAVAWMELFLVLCGLSLSAAYAQQAGIEQRLTRCTGLRLTVTDESMEPIIGASVSIQGVWTAITDMRGIVSMDCPPGFSYPLTVEVRAHGFENQTGHFSTDRARVFLQRKLADASSYPSGATAVGVEELSRGIQEKSSQLRNKAADAIDRGDDSAAETFLVGALELTPSVPEIYNDIAYTFIHRGRLDKAAGWLSKGLEIARFNPMLTGNLGLVRWLQGLRDESYRLLVDADARGFDTPSAHYVLGVLFLENGEPRKSVEHISRIDARKFKLRDLYLALSLREIGKSKEAADKYRDYLRRNPARLVRSAPSGFSEQTP